MKTSLLGEEIMATLQVRIDDDLKKKSDSLFAGLGLDTPTAIRIFLTMALEHEGFPFNIAHRRELSESKQAIEDARNHTNLYGPYNSAKDAVNAMLED